MTLSDGQTSEAGWDRTGQTGTYAEEVVTGGGDSNAGGGWEEKVGGRAGREHGGR